jgi:hypothetical protein
VGYSKIPRVSERDVGWRARNEADSTEVKLDQARVKLCHHCQEHAQRPRQAKKRGSGLSWNKEAEGRFHHSPPELRARRLTRHRVKQTLLYLLHRNDDINSLQWQRKTPNSWSGFRIKFPRAASKRAVGSIVGMWQTGSGKAIHFSACSLSRPTTFPNPEIYEMEVSR